MIKGVRGHRRWRKRRKTGRRNSYIQKLTEKKKYK